MRIRRENWIWIATVLCWTMVLACGGGGGGSDSEGDVQPATTYSGVTTQAVLTEVNAMDLAMNSYFAGLTGTVAMGGSYSSYTVSSKMAPDLPQRQALAVIRDSIQYIDRNSENRNTRNASATGSNTEYGNCGGNISVTVNVNESTGDFTGTMSYNSFCQDGVTISGRGQVSGRMNLYTEEMQRFSMTFNSLSVSELVLSYTMSGWIEFRMNEDGSETDRFDILMRDDATGQVEWANDYTTVATPSASGMDVTITGRYYDPDEGYVDIRTNSFLHYEDPYDWPVQGTLIVTGYASTQIYMVFNMEGLCRLEGDLDGDDEVDWMDDYWFPTS